MSMQDTIADLLTHIRNGLLAGKELVSLPSSKIKVAIAKVLEEEGYIVGSKVVGADTPKPALEVYLKYFEGKPVISKISRYSRPGLRAYKGAADLPKVLGGLGVAIVSTNKGVMSCRQARKSGLGGEVLCTVE